MPTFAATVIDPRGHRRVVSEDAPDPTQVMSRLRTRGLWPLTVDAVKPNRKFARRKLPTRDFVALLNQLELQLRAGITADTALSQLAADLPRGMAKSMLEHIEREVRQGRPIHEACRFFENQFPGHIAAIIAAGETSAQLPAALRSLARFLTEMDELKRTARRALIYPVTVLIAVGLLTGFLLAVVIPQFADVFSSLQLALPKMTVFVIRLSVLMRADWPLALAAFVAPLVGLWLLPKIPRGRFWRDAALLRLPLAGDIARHLATARFAAHLGILHGAGIPLLDALQTGAELTGNMLMTRRLLAAREAVAAGAALSAALPLGKEFPAFIASALRAGEAGGQLGEALRHIETYSSARAKERLLVTLALLEPALIGSLTGIVGFIALSFFLPLAQLLGGLSSR